MPNKRNAPAAIPSSRTPAASAAATSFDPWVLAALTDRVDAYRRALTVTQQLGGLAQVNHPNFHHGASAPLLATLARAFYSSSGVLLDRAQWL